MKTNTYIVRFFFFCSILLLPFYNNFPYSFNHISRSPTTYSILLLIFISLVFGVKKYTLKKGDRPLNIVNIFFLVYAIILLFHILFFDGGIKTNGKKIATVIYTAVIVLTINSAIIKNYIKEYHVFKAVYYSSFLLVPYCLLETLAYTLNVSIIDQFLSFIEPYLHEITHMVETKGLLIQHSPRVRGFAMEPSYFASVLAFVLPWLISFSIIKPNMKNILLLLCLLFTLFFTSSQNVFLVVFVIISIFWVYFLIIKKIKFFYTILLLLIILLIGFNSINFSEVFSIEEDTNFSNIIRFYTFIAGFNLFVDNPLFGVGNDITTSLMVNYYPSTIIGSSIVKIWLLDREGAAGLFSLFLRIMLEGGLVLFLLFMTVWAYLIRKNFKIVMNKYRLYRVTDYYSLSIVAMLIGLLVSAIGVEVYLYYGYFIAWGIAAGNISKNLFFAYHPVIRKYRQQQFSLQLSN